MKCYLLSVALLASSAAIAATDYDSCINNSNTEVCRAYLAGLSHGKANVDITAMVEPKESFRSRALEQRVGERYRKTVQTEKKPIQLIN